MSNKLSEKEVALLNDLLEELKRDEQAEQEDEDTKCCNSSCCCCSNGENTVTVTVEDFESLVECAEKYRKLLRRLSHDALTKYRERYEHSTVNQIDSTPLLHYNDYLEKEIAEVEALLNSFDNDNYNDVDEQ